jgi:hypothetical protein
VCSRRGFASAEKEIGLQHPIVQKRGSGKSESVGLSRFRDKMQRISQKLGRSRVRIHPEGDSYEQNFDS